MIRKKQDKIHMNVIIMSDKKRPLKKSVKKVFCAIITGLCYLSNLSRNKQ